MSLKFDFDDSDADGTTHANYQSILVVEKL